jgi:hypothetical protein
VAAPPAAIWCELDGLRADPAIRDAAVGCSGSTIDDTETAERVSTHRDRGGSLIEILIAIVLLGGVVGGTLATLRATILSGAV